MHTHGAKPGLLGRLAAKATGVPVVLHTYHGHIFHSYFNRLVSALVVRAERWLAKRSTAIIAISEHLKKELSETYRIAPPEKIVTIPLLLNLEQFADKTGGGCEPHSANNTRCRSRKLPWALLVA